MSNTPTGHEAHGGNTQGGKPRSHRPHNPPYYDPSYEDPIHYHHEPPVNLRYPDPRIYGSYASTTPPRYVPHPFEHACFKPRECDYKPPTRCHDDSEDLCVRKDHRMLTASEQNRFLNAFSQVNAINALGPLVDIHSNAIHQNPTLAGAAATMDPWSETEIDTRDVTALGFTYV